MNPSRILEIMLYELIDLLPNLLLALLPFHGSLRFTRKVTALFVVLLYSLLTVSRVLALGSIQLAGFMSGSWIFLYLVFYASCIHVQPAKLFYVLLIILNYGSFIAILYSYFAYYKYPGIASRPYSVYSSVLLVLFYAVSYPLMYLFITRLLRPLMMPSENNRYWNYLFLVPATFCLSYYYNLYANGGIIAFSSFYGNVLFAVFFNLGSLFVNYLVLHLLAASNALLALKAENYSLTMQTLQYENMQSRMEEARRARHDLRHNLMLLHSFLQHKDYDAMQEYLCRYLASLPSDTPITYCRNYALNALLVYYGDCASKNEVDFHAEAEYPEEASIQDTDAVVLLGNLLENALESCIRQQKGKRFLDFHMKNLQGLLVITLDNSFSHDIQMSNGKFLSSKTGCAGIGTSSIKKIVEKYNGTVTYSHEKHVFHASVMLRLPVN